MGFRRALCPVLRALCFDMQRACRARTHLMHRIALRFRLQQALGVRDSLSRGSFYSSRYFNSTDQYA